MQKEAIKNLQTSKEEGICMEEISFAKYEQD